MNMDEEEIGPFGAGYGTGCDIHGDDYLRECTMCGIEYCAACNPRSPLCPDCAAQAALDDDEEEAPAGEADKELRLLDGFNDDEPPAEPVPATPAATKGKPKEKPATAAKPARKSARPAPGLKSRPQAKKKR